MNNKPLYILLWYQLILTPSQIDFRSKDETPTYPTQFSRLMSASYPTRIRTCCILVMNHCCIYNQYEMVYRLNYIEMNAYPSKWNMNEFIVFVNLWIKALPKGQRPTFYPNAYVCSSFYVWCWTHETNLHLFYLYLCRRSVECFIGCSDLCYICDTITIELIWIELNWIYMNRYSLMYSLTRSI